MSPAGFGIHDAKPPCLRATSYDRVNDRVNERVNTCSVGATSYDRVHDRANTCSVGVECIICTVPHMTSSEGTPDGPLPPAPSKTHYFEQNYSSFSTKPIIFNKTIHHFQQKSGYFGKRPVDLKLPHAILVIERVNIPTEIVHMVDQFTCNHERDLSSAGMYIQRRQLYTYSQ